MFISAMLEGHLLTEQEVLTVFITVMAVVGGLPTFQTDGKEYCQWETFKAKCEPGEVIFVNSAYYGRMESGRCIKRDYGYVGCYTDVLHLADWKCSGKQQCNISVPDKLFDGTRPCPDDLKMYLTAKFDCVKVITRSPLQCRSSRMIEVSSSDGYLASTVTKHTGCGSAKSPWLIQRPSGQKLQITLVDFNRISNRTMPAGGGVLSHSHCQVYAIIKDKSIRKPKRICRGTGTGAREQVVFLSQTNQVEVRIVTKDAGKGRTTGEFLLKYETLGCADLKPPPYGWWERTGETATIGCAESKHTWTLVCKDRIWVGDQGNCSHYPATGFSTSLQYGIGSLSQVSSFIVILCIALVIGGCIVFTGIILLRRRWKRQSAGLRMQSQKVAYSKDTTYMTPKSGPTYFTSPALLTSGDQTTPEENEYAYVDDLPPPPRPIAGQEDKITTECPLQMLTRDIYGIHERYHLDQGQGREEVVYETNQERNRELNEYFVLDPEAVADCGLHH